MAIALVQKVQARRPGPDLSDVELIRLCVVHRDEGKIMQPTVHPTEPIASCQELGDVCSMILEVQEVRCRR